MRSRSALFFAFVTSATGLAINADAQQLCPRPVGTSPCGPEPYKACSLCQTCTSDSGWTVTQWEPTGTLCSNSYDGPVSGTCVLQGSPKYGTASCTGPLPTYTVGGTVSGLNGNPLVLTLFYGSPTKSDKLTVSQPGTFTFSARLPDYTSGWVQLTTPPVGETCTPSDSGNFKIDNANITNIQFTCSPSWPPSNVSASCGVGTSSVSCGGQPPYPAQSSGSYLVLWPSCPAGDVPLGTPPADAPQVCAYAPPTTNAISQWPAHCQTSQVAGPSGGNCSIDVVSGSAPTGIVALNGDPCSGASHCNDSGGIVFSTSGESIGQRYTISFDLQWVKGISPWQFSNQTGLGDTNSFTFEAKNQFGLTGTMANGSTVPVQDPCWHHFVYTATIDKPKYSMYVYPQTQALPFSNEIRIANVAMGPASSDAPDSPPGMAVPQGPAVCPLP